MNNWRVEDQRITIPRHSRTDHSKRSYGGIDLDGITLVIHNNRPSKMPKANQTKATLEYLGALNVHASVRNRSSKHECFF